MDDGEFHSMGVWRSHSSVQASWYSSLGEADGSVLKMAYSIADVALQL